MFNYTFISSFLWGWLADRVLGDPEGWPHPIIWFGKLITKGEKTFNKDENRKQKGLAFALTLIIGIFCITAWTLNFAALIHPMLAYTLSAIGVFYCLAGKTLAKEVQAVFEAVDQNLEKGRKQLARIVGRDTQALNAQEIRAAALETLAENLSDGVIAPMFWFILLGVPGMLTYKLINTLDSMIGYQNDRYKEFGYAAAKIDDIANYIPARLTSFLMLIVSNQWNKRSFVIRYSRNHTSPNSGWPEAALASILNCRFGGTHTYFGTEFKKPYIGINERPFTTKDMLTGIHINEHTELLMGIITLLLTSTGHPIFVHFLNQLVLW